MQKVNFGLFFNIITPFFTYFRQTRITQKNQALPSECLWIPIFMQNIRKKVMNQFQEKGITNGIIEIRNDGLTYLNFATLE